MAAPCDCTMRAIDPIRVKLFFDGFHIESSWFNVSTKCVKTISDVEQKITAKFDLGDKSVKLVLADCRIPAWESVDILREGDSIHVVEDSGQQRVFKKKIKNGTSHVPSVEEVTINKGSDNGAGDALLQREETQHKKKSRDTGHSAVFDEQDKNMSLEVLQKWNSSSVKVIENLKQQNQEKDVVLRTSEVAPEDDIAVSETSERKRRKRKRKKKKHGDEGDTSSYSPPKAEILSKTKPFINPSKLNGHSNYSNNHVTFDDDNDETPSDNHLDQETNADYSEVISQDINTTEETILPGGISVYTRPKRKRPNYSYNEEMLMQTSTEWNTSEVNECSNNGEISNRKSHKLSENEVKVQEKSVVAVNSTDFSQFPNLEGPPNCGDKIAFKVVELSERFCPEVSDFKIAIVQSYNPISTVVELQMLSNISENSEEIVTHDWSSLMEPKLLS